MLTYKVPVGLGRTLAREKQKPNTMPKVLRIKMWTKSTWGFTCKQNPRPM